MFPQKAARRHVALVWQPYHPYTWEAVHRFVPQQAGVYKLAYPTVNGTLAVFYVGPSLDLDSRLKDHLSDDEPNYDLRLQLVLSRCRFAYAVVPLSNDRDAAEAALYRHFTPSCNGQIPTGPNYNVSPMTSG